VHTVNSTLEGRKQEKFWHSLIGIISKGGVVPIVGEDLLRLSSGQGEDTLYETLALRYSASYDMALDPAQKRNLSAVIRHHPDFQTNPHDVYCELKEEYDALNPAIPEPLRALARVRHFNLFVSTTFDDLLERALNEERFGGRKLTEVITYSPKNVPDDKQISAQLALGRPVVFQVFGNCMTPLQYALTEGDKVEYMHALQTAEYRPNRIFDELYTRPLLLLGNRFPDWLTRMFLRMIRKTPLDHTDVPKQYVADAKGAEDVFMRLFLLDFTKNTELVESLDPVELIRELSARWHERFGNQEVAPVAATPAGAKPMPKNAVFISYCATDASGQPARDGQVALAIREALEARGIDVWLDKDQLQGGDEFERKIKRYIDTCSLFMPLISQTTQSRDDGFFRKEWNWALSKLLDFTGSDRQFIFPVVIDDVNPYRAKVPEEFKRFQFTPVFGTAPDAQFLNRIQWLYEKICPPRP
jgi:hypothetical protein